MGLTFNPLGNTVFIVLRGYTKHETSSHPNRRARMETDTSPSHSYLWDLQTTARQSVHVEKGVPGCYGEVCAGSLRGFGHGASKAKTRVLFPAPVLFLWMCCSLVQGWKNFKIFFLRMCNTALHSISFILYIMSLAQSEHVGAQLFLCFCRNFSTYPDPGSLGRVLQALSILHFSFPLS